MSHAAPSDVRKWHADGPDHMFSGPQDKMAYHFSHVSEFLPHARIKRADQTTMLQEHPDGAAWAETRTQSTFGDLSFKELAEHADHPLRAITVLRGGKVLYHHARSFRHDDRHTLMSVTKAMVGGLISIGIDEGKLALTTPVVSYLPWLKGTEWEGVLLAHALNQCSGIDAHEEGPGAYDDPDHPHFAYDRAMGFAGYSKTGEDPFDIVASLKRRHPPGKIYEYCSVNTFVLAQILEDVFASTLGDLISERIWRPIGAAHDADLMLSPQGAPSGCGGMSTTISDLARYGMAYTQSGRDLFGDVIPASYTDLLSTAEPFLAPEISEGSTGGYPMGLWHWDKVWEDGDMFKLGWGGQGLYVSPRTDSVVAFFGELDAQQNKNVMPIVVRDVFSKEKP